MCKKEIWVYLLANNLIRLVMAQAAQNKNLKPRELSFKHAVQIWNTYNLMGKEIDAEMFALIAECRVGKRPGRLEPRAVKRRPKSYKLLTVERSKARMNVMKNGHPKKTK